MVTKNHLLSYCVPLKERTRIGKFLIGILIKLQLLGTVVGQRARVSTVNVIQVSERRCIVYLRLDVDDGHQSGGVDLSDRVHLGAVHGVVVRAVLEVVSGGDVSHHLLVCHEDVAASVLLVSSSRPRRV